MDIDPETIVSLNLYNYTLEYTIFQELPKTVI